MMETVRSIASHAKALNLSQRAKVLQEIPRPDAAHLHLNDAIGQSGQARPAQARSFAEA